MPTVNSTDSRMVKAIDGWLGMYEACYLLAIRSDDRLRAKNYMAEQPAHYGLTSADRPQPSHLLTALLNAAQALNEWNGSWVLGGGLAMSFHGRERATRDVDFFLFEDKERLNSVLETLSSHDLQPHTIERPSFLPPDAQFWWVPLQCGLPSAAPVDVDLLVASHEFMTFLQQTGIETEINGIRVRVIGAEALIILKLRAYRDQDKADLEALLKKKFDLNRNQLDGWIKKFKIRKALGTNGT